jgi:hypothetical protein
MACFTANPNKSFTLYYNLLEYFRVIMTNHPSINRVTQGDIFSFDTDEYPTYPIGNILVTNTAFNDKNTVLVMYAIPIRTSVMNRRSPITRTRTAMRTKHRAGVPQERITDFVRGR